MYNCVVILGPTAAGKTAVAVQLASMLNGEILSADSRQVYRGLDIGSGKDIAEYTLPSGRIIPYHLIDIASLDQEFSVFDYQKEFYTAFQSVIDRGVSPVICGGTGMYLDAAVRGYDLVEVPVNKELRDSLAGKPLEELSQILLALKGSLHNHTDTDERHRVLRAIEIETYTRSDQARIQREKMTPRPDIKPYIVGTTFPRDILRARAGKRLRERFEQGMIDEVRALHDSGVAWERLERLGLEYKYLAQYLQGKISSYNELFRSLHIAIGQFIKRQETWFRGMERKGSVIHWLKYDNTPESASAESRAHQIVSLLKNEEHTFNL